MVKLYVLYILIRKLTMPYKNWAAFKLGIIDAEGNTLIKTKDFTTIEQRKAWTHLDIAARNLRRVLSKFSTGSKLLGSYAAAMWLMKEETEYGYPRRLNESAIENEIEDLIQKLKAAGIDKILGEDEGGIGGDGSEPVTNQTGNIDGYDMPLIPYLSRRKPRDMDDLNEHNLIRLIDDILGKK